MTKDIEVYIHGEGCGSKKLKISESATLAQLLEQAKKAGFISPADGHPFKICLEDEDVEHEHHHPLPGCGVHHHTHVHCHRCEHIAVTVTYNGVSKSQSFKTSATGMKIRKWALDEFKLKGADAADKVLRFENKDVLDDTAHIGTFAHFPKCAVQLFLTSLVEVQG